jgi:retinoblastoma-like protein 1
LIDLFLMAPVKPLTWEIPISQRSVEEYLMKSYKSWGEDVTDVLSSRAHSIVKTIFPDKCIQRFNTLALYYEVLESVCRAKKKEPKTLHAILTSEIFHRCLLACAAAVQVLQITRTSSTVTKMFPADRVLKSSGITAFDLSHTITASFITHQDSFPGYFSRHLNSFKEQLLESMAWKKGSSLYNSLSLARPSLSPQINRLELFAQSMPSFNQTMLDLEAAETMIDLFFREVYLPTPL